MSRNNTKPIRILHVVGGMNRGGVETWLMHILRNIDRDRFRTDFMVHTDKPCVYDGEVLALGSKIIPCLHPSKPLAYARNFRHIMNEFGPFDVIHSHVHHFSGHILRLARQAGIPVRIAHSHLDTTELHKKARFLRHLYIYLATQMISHNATVGLAASRKAAKALFGTNWEADQRWQLLYCGIDLSSFKLPIDSITVRKELGIPADAFVLGHVGRFMEQKNHGFLIDIMSEVAKREPKTYLLLVGDGELRQAIQQKVTRAGLADKVIFAGVRSDVPRLMLGAMDIFVMPSLYEGLPLVGLEVQSAGLPFLLSDTTTEELDVVMPLIKRLSLSQPALDWAQEVLALRNTEPEISRSDALTLMKETGFNITSSIKNLEKVYYG